MGKMPANEEQAAWAQAVNIVFPGQDGRGTHVNVSGAAITRHAPNATRLLEFLSGDQAQGMYAEVNSEYPIKAAVPWSEQLNSWGPFKVDDLSLARVADFRRAAVKLADKVGYDRWRLITAHPKRPDGTTGLAFFDDRHAHIHAPFHLARLNPWPVLAGVIVVPVGAAIWLALFPSENVWAHLVDTVLADYVSTTAWLMAGVGGGVLVLGVGAAWLVTMCRLPGRGLFGWMLLLPFAVPAYVIAYVYTDLLE